MRRLAYISWGSGALASILGLWISLEGDLPTGPLIVCMYGLVLVGALVLRKRSEEHTSELQSRPHLVCRLLLAKKNTEEPERGREGSSVVTSSRGAYDWVPVD